MGTVTSDSRSGTVKFRLCRCCGETFLHTPGAGAESSHICFACDQMVGEFEGSRKPQARREKPAKDPLRATPRYQVIADFQQD
jgi:hypothetical protein